MELPFPITLRFVAAWGAGLVALTPVTTSISAADGGAPDAAGWADREAQALQGERKDCDAGDLDACLWGQTRPLSEAERLHLLEKACQIGPRGCVNLAYALAGGHQRVPLDVARATALAEPLCLDGPDPREVGPACVILAQITPEPERVRKLLVRACDYGWWGYGYQIYSTYWLPGEPRFHANCLDRKRLGKPYRRR